MDRGFGILDTFCTRYSQSDCGACAYDARTEWGEWDHSAIPSPMAAKSSPSVGGSDRFRGAFGGMRRRGTKTRRRGRPVLPFRRGTEVSEATAGVLLSSVPESSDTLPGCTGTSGCCSNAPARICTASWSRSMTTSNTSALLRRRCSCLGPAARPRSTGLFTISSMTTASASARRAQTSTHACKSTSPLAALRARLSAWRSSALAATGWPAYPGYALPTGSLSEAPRAESPR